MFCPNCGTQIDNEQSAFCFSCGYSLKGVPGAAPAAPAASANAVPANAVAATNVSINRLATTDEPGMKLPPNLNPVKIQAKNQNVPVKYELREYKAKCEYCYNVFTYHDNHIGKRAWYPHGFVKCPYCHRPLRHHGEQLLSEIHHLIVYPDGTVIEPDKES